MNIDWPSFWCGAFVAWFAIGIFIDIVTWRR